MRRNRPRHSRFGGSDLEHMRIRNELFDLLLRVADEDHLTMWSFASMLGVSHARACDLMHRRIEKFNSETLIDILARVGVKLELRPITRDRYRVFGENPIFTRTP
jgi:predicted XRE-type DNA-binding protein